jgi:hypothetical protein
LGVSVWRIAQREEVSEATIQNRIDRSVARIIRQFVGVNIPVERIEEPYQGVAYAIIFEKATGEVGEVKFMKIYVGGKGMWRAGRYLKDRDTRPSGSGSQKILDQL